MAKMTVSTSKLSYFFVEHVKYVSVVGQYEVYICVTTWVYILINSDVDTPSNQVVECHHVVFGCLSYSDTRQGF